MFKRILVFLFALALNTSAFAGSSTIGVTAGSGNTYDVITDGSGNFVGMFGLCDGTAAASCAAVTSGAVKIAGAGTAGTPSGGVLSVQGVSGGTAQPMSIASGGVASGAIASGAVASGAFASGSLASGAGTDGWNVTEGTKADSAWSSGSGSIVAILKTVATNTGSIIPGCQIKATTTCTVIGSVFNGANTYNTVAVSQTAQALTGGSGGATGDYLSHCVLSPNNTTAGSVIIYDNSTAIFTMPSATLSNLVPFTIPFGAKSVSGAFKVTTPSTYTVLCVGAFT